MTQKASFSTIVDVERDDGVCSLQLELHNETEEHLFVRLMSWDESGSHEKMKSLMGRKLRVTVEAFDEEADTSELYPEDMTRSQMSLEEDRLSEIIRSLHRARADAAKNSPDDLPAIEANLTAAKERNERVSNAISKWTEAHE